MKYWFFAAWFTLNVAMNQEQNLSNQDLTLIDATDLDFEEKRVIEVYEQVSPSVVSITTQVVQYDIFFDPYTQEGAGSGFVLDIQVTLIEEP
jgi:S1-C subfamily serine protease